MSGEIKENGLWRCSPVLEHSAWYKTISLGKKTKNKKQISSWRVRSLLQIGRRKSLLIAWVVTKHTGKPVLETYELALLFELTQKRVNSEAYSQGSAPIWLKQSSQVRTSASSHTRGALRSNGLCLHLFFSTSVPSPKELPGSDYKSCWSWCLKCEYLEIT